MARSRLVFFLILGAALVVVLAATLISPQLQALNSSQAATATAQFIRDNNTTLRLVYGTEKERWLTDAVARYSTTNPGVKIELVGQGSMESYQALSQVNETSTSLPRNEPIPVLWSPASTIQVNLLNAASKTAMNRELAVNCKRLVLSPLVIMVWEDRAKVFEAHYKDKGGITFANLYDALHSTDISGKWSAIGGQAKWGLIKIGHTHPMTSNSGTMTLVALGNNYYQRTAAITVPEITDDKFVEWMATLERAVTTPLISSTGTFANDVIVKGPASYDFVVVYEALAIEHYKNAVGKQGQGLRLVYPEYNPSISPRQREAALAFQAFLLSPEIQKLALTYGFRPADPSVPIFGAGSDFDSAELKAAGVSNDIGQELQVPDGNTINQLLTVWKRNFGS
jgi:Bacterial extracellular solute-binding protein